MITLEDLRGQEQPAIRLNFREPMMMDQLLSHVRIISGQENAGGELRGSKLLRIEMGGPRNPHDYVWRDCGAPDVRDRSTFQDWPGVRAGDPVTIGHLMQLGLIEKKKAA